MGVRASKTSENSKKLNRMKSPCNSRHEQLVAYVRGKQRAKHSSCSLLQKYSDDLSYPIRLEDGNTATNFQMLSSRSPKNQHTTIDKVKDFFGNNKLPNKAHSSFSKDYQQKLGLSLKMMTPKNENFKVGKRFSLPGNRRLTVDGLSNSHVLTLFGNSSSKNVFSERLDCRDINKNCGSRYSLPEVSIQSSLLQEDPKGFSLPKPTLKSLEQGQNLRVNRQKKKRILSEKPNKYWINEMRRCSIPEVEHVRKYSLPVEKLVNYDLTNHIKRNSFPEKGSPRFPFPPKWVSNLKHSKDSPTVDLPAKTGISVSSRCFDLTPRYDSD